MISTQIKQLRISSNLTQKEFGKLFNVSKQCVSSWENSYVMPTAETLKEIAIFFKVSSDCILELDSRQFIDCTKLTDEELAHERNIINDITKNR